MNVIAHIGNGTIIENAAIGIENGTFSLVADATTIKINPSNFDTIIYASGKHLYPGFIASNSTLGLTEIEAVRATNDFSEVGNMVPHVRTLIAYNTDSDILPTVLSNGILYTQVVPRSNLLAGKSSVLKLNGNNWEDAVLKADDGVHLYFPKHPLKKTIEHSTTTIATDKKEQYEKQLKELYKFMADAKAYNQLAEKKESNIRFDALKDVFNGTQRLYIHTDEVKNIVAALAFIKEYEIKNPVLVGAKDCWLVLQQIKEANVPLMIGRTHELPARADEDINIAYKLPYILKKKGILFCLQNEGDMEAMNARNLSFLAGSAAAYGLTKEEALSAITLNVAKIMGVDHLIGSITVDKVASFFISSGDALDMKSNSIENIYLNGNKITLANEQVTLYEKYLKKYNLK